MAMNPEIYLYDAIGDWGISASSVVDQVKAAGNYPIDVRINSVGGDVFAGYTIYNLFANHKPGINVYVDGLAASIASYIAMAGQRIYMAENSMLMIHNPSSMAGGDADEMRKQADILDKVTNSLVNAYQKRTGLPKEAIQEMLDEETWLDAETALAFGFVDEITQPLELAASFDKAQLSKFRNCPEHLLKMATDKINDPQIPSAPISTDSENGNSENLRESTKSADESKPSIFSRVSAMLKEKSSLVELVAKHEAEIKAEVEAHAKTKAQLSDVAHALADSNAKVAAYEKAEKELNETIENLQAESKAAEDKAKNIVASLGFDQTKLPAPVSAEDAQAAKAAAEPQDFAGWMAKYESIKDPAEKQKFLRENETKIWAAREAARKAEKK